MFNFAVNLLASLLLLLCKRAMFILNHHTLKFNRGQGDETPRTLKVALDGTERLA
jgi:hypothetical protein